MNLFCDGDVLKIPSLELIYRGAKVPLFTVVLNTPVPGTCTDVRGAHGTLLADRFSTSLLQYPRVTHGYTIRGYTRTRTGTGGSGCGYG
jgi:hypothetical protein